jgi:hypothetical protein
MNAEGKKNHDQDLPLELQDNPVKGETREHT